VTLTSDFGQRDSYVAEMKGRLLRACPDLVMVDVSHEIPAGDVAAGAFVLDRACRAFPPGTVHLAVVDPGVGTGRRALAARTGRGWLVGPDNGLLTPLLDEDALVVALDPSRVTGREPTPTFHGRDLFAPAAGRLARGDRIEDLGEPLTDPVPLPRPAGACVLHVDRFGNCVTSLAPRELPDGGAWRLQAGRGEVTRRVRTYGDAPPGEPVLLVGSDGRIEIAVRDGRACDVLGLTPGDALHVVGDSPAVPGSSTPRKEKKP
jgi:S-adenosylmethionine hydrolase